MKQLRVISPASLTEELVRFLSDDPDVAHVMVLPGAAAKPPGDVVVADVARESASAVIERIRAAGVCDGGAIVIDDIGAVISDNAERADRSAAGQPGDAVVWEDIEQRTGEETRLSASYLIFMTIAIVIAGIGVLNDQPILVIGAMVVGPDFGPLAALCVALVRRRPRMAGSALLAIAVGFAVGMAGTVLATWGLAAIGLADAGMLTAPRPQTDFIWAPDALSWVIGVLAGVAGMLSLTTAKSGALVGVLISVTTIPAAGNAAVALALGVPGEVGGSLLQLAINLAAIVAAGTVTLGVQRVLYRRRSRRTDVIADRDLRRVAG
ncbi:DUF389 domain-containing protein [Herbiconiux sp. 11R-BC]|uniref:DUF389 domain-containing protein n=1 Tax=Herbiconiux sp. 11R-BC TaxID=3111637 RepID=UPI003BFC7F59